MQTSMEDESATAGNNGTASASDSAVIASLPEISASVPTTAIAATVQS